MNALLVTGIFPPDRGGPASYVPRMAAALVQRGHHVEVVCLSDRLDHAAGEHGFRVHRVRRSAFWPWRVLLTTFTVWRAARRHDLVFVNGLGAESALAAALAGRPAVHKVVGDYAWERATGRGWFGGTLDEYQTCAKPLRLRLLDFVRTFPLRLARAVVTPSRYLRGIVRGWGLGEDKVRVIWNAVERIEPAATAAPALTPSPAGGKTLVTVCRLEPWKGVDGLIRLLPALPADTRLVVVGDGGQRTQLAAEAAACGVSARVEFLGSVPPAEVRRHLAGADAFVLNSTYEGLPHVVLEAMTAGVPVIATDAGGTGEVVENEITGLLIPVGDPAALRAAVERLWGDPALGRRLVAQATRELAARFDFEAMVAATEGVLGSAARVEPHPGTPTAITVEEGQ